MGGYTFINAGISGNELLYNSRKHGKKGTTRFGGYLPDLAAALIWLGNNDITAGASASRIETGYLNLIAQAHAAGVPIIGGTLQPSNFKGRHEATRQAVNSWIRSSHAFNAVADFSNVLMDPRHPNRMASWVYNVGQAHGNHPGNPGYMAVARVAENALFKVLGYKTHGGGGVYVPPPTAPKHHRAATGHLESLTTLRRHFDKYYNGDKGAMSLFEKHLWHLLHIGTPWSSIQKMYPHGKPKGYALGGIIKSAIGAAKMTAAAFSGNEVAFVNALTGIVGGSPGVGGKIGAMAATLPVAMMSKVVGSIWHAITGGAKSSAGSFGAGGPGGGSALQNQALARSLMPAWGSGPFWSDWLMLWNRESGWNQFANNPTSGAYGIPQSLPYNKMPKAGWPASAGGSSNPRAQISWGIGYIGGRYGNPANAWDHEMSSGWYDHGGVIKPGLTMVRNDTGRDEYVSSGHGGGGGVQQNFYIKTNEINPRLHASQLGFELARRSS
jgi:hypothetical protein